jgi:hypothetical protein
MRRLLAVFPEKVVILSGRRRMIGRCTCPGGFCLRFLSASQRITLGDLFFQPESWPVKLPDSKFGVAQPSPPPPCRLAERSARCNHPVTRSQCGAACRSSCRRCQAGLVTDRTALGAALVISHSYLPLLHASGWLLVTK